MIVKSYEINKINPIDEKFFLFYGKNDGLKNEATIELLRNKEEIFSYDEKEILSDPDKFIEDVMSKSLFEDEKIIIIKRVTDKILNLISELNEKKIEGLIIILNSEDLEKKSKLRLFFERSKTHICTAFYPDTEQTLFRVANLFFKERKISISSSNLNIIINKSNGDREVLVNELKKIESYTKNGKKITFESIIKLTNLAEDHSISKLIDNCLAKNKSKIISILNENSFNNEDCILITRIFLNKSKKILELAKKFEKNKNIDQTISDAKPPIFWKDKDIIKKQLHVWSSKNIKELICKLNEIELIAKKNMNNSINIIKNFILEITLLNNSNN
tara:strand:+ start:1727 stop:2722 length:996 start_codon:yes stop_codon:yes gene_type:complete